MGDKYGYSIQDPPPSCMECEWHGRTFSPTTHCHTYWYDYCKLIRRYFAKMHIVLRGEYRILAKHDEDDLRGPVLPYECPYFDISKVFWEMYGRIQMNVEYFVIECSNHWQDYKGWYVYTLTDNIAYLKEEIPDEVGLNYLPVATKDVSWFIQNFGVKEVLLSDTDPSHWVYPVPPEPI